MRRDEQKIYGPFEHGDKWRVHVVTRVGGRRKTLYRSFASRSIADAFIDGARAQAQGITVSDAIDQYLETKITKGREENTLTATRNALRMMLGAYMQRPLRAIASRGEELYAAAQYYPAGHKRAGQARAADTHRVALSRARTFGRWCVKKKLLKIDPWADVEPMGKRTVGADKSRLTVDESRRLRQFCHAHSADPGAVLTLGYLLLGARASELVNRCVRDLDDGGRLLCIGKTKSVAGRRRLQLPDELASLLQLLAAGQPSDAPLFATEGRRWSRFTARLHVRRICEAAGVPVLSPQALRRTQATLATDAGATALMVAQHLGHATGEAPAVTGQAYIGRASAKDAQIERAVRAISGSLDDRFRGNSVETASETAEGASDK